MAEALLRLIAGNHFEAESAGIHPAGLHPLTVEVMQEIGVNIRHHRSKSVEEFLNQVSWNFREEGNVEISSGE